MKLFKFFKSSNDTTPTMDNTNVEVSPTHTEATSVDSPTPAPASTVSDDSNTSAEKKKQSEELIAITYGTGMPIDVIYAYIGKDYEPDGYEDALVNPSVEYCKTKESIILNRLQQLFRQVSLTYKGEIRNLEVQIENSKSLFNLTSAAMLEARRDTCKEHITEIQQMLEKLKSNAPEMMTMIDSYRRGFSKGVSAQTASFLGTHK